MAAKVPDQAARAGGEASAAMPVKTQERVGKRVSKSGLLNSTVVLSATDRRMLCTISKKKNRKPQIQWVSNQNMNITVQIEKVFIKKGKFAAIKYQIPLKNICTLKICIFSFFFKLSMINFNKKCNNNFLILVNITL